MKYKVPFVDFSKNYQVVKQRIDKAIQGCLASGDLILRDDVEKFEQTLADYTGVNHAVGLNSGTDALILALKVLDIGEGDEVITSPFTFAATIASIVHVGATPVLVDINVDDMLIDVDKIEEAITDKTKAIIPVHLAGAVCDMDRIMGIACNYDLFVIEDAAQALGAKGIGRGDVSCWSFYPAKILGAYGDAGAITTDSEHFAEFIRSLRHGGRGEGKKIVHWGYTSRLDNIQAAILNVKFDQLRYYLARRKEIAMLYDKGLKSLEDKVALPVSQVYQDYVIRIEDRKELMAFLQEKGVETLSGEYSLPIDVDLPITNDANRTALRLPICPELEDWQIEYVINAIKEYYEV